MRAASALLILIATAIAHPARVHAQAAVAQPRLCTPETREETRAAFTAMWAKYEDLPREHPEIYNNYPVVELVTMGVGGLIWERHGHIALCVRFSPTEERCYNYGIGDFHHPIGMATGFFRGTHSFWVGPMDPDNMFATYLCADRSIWVQPLPLSDAEEKKVIDKLEYDIQEEHKSYAYDHFWDNCTTRVRDDLDDATGGKLRALKGPSDDRTYRDLARKGFFGMRIPLLITDLAMGRVTDRVPTYYEKMFLPDYLREAAEKAWGIKPATIYERVGPPPLDNGPSGRVILALIALLMTAPAWATRLWGRLERTGLAISVLPWWFLGVVFWFLAIVSPLPYVRWNETCLVLLPTDILLVWFLSPERRVKYARARVAMLAIVAGLLLVNVLKQPIWPAMIWPLVPALVVGFMRRSPPAPAPGPSDGEGEKKSGKGKGKGKGK